MKLNIIQEDREEIVSKLQLKSGDILHVFISPYKSGDIQSIADMYENIVPKGVNVVVGVKDLITIKIVSGLDETNKVRIV